MATLREIKKRINTVKNISQVTRAMELVSASKMKRAQQNALKSRPFAHKIEEISKNLSLKIDPKLHPLLNKRAEIKVVLIVLISPPRGLCGPLVPVLLKNTFDFTAKLRESKANKIEFKYVVIEKKGKDALLRMGENIVAYFEKLGERPEVGDLKPIIKIIIDGFLSKEFDEVYLSYTHFVSTLTQKPTISKVLPISVAQLSKEGEDYNYLLEPSPDEILKTLLPQYLNMQLYQFYLEAIASEHSARMVSMKSATDNAEEVKNALTVEYNKSRQASITTEIGEIASGAEASK